jgi:hypothetical protein
MSNPVDGVEGDNFIVMRNFGDADGYCLLANYAVHYGGVESVEITEGQTRFIVSEEAATILGADTEIIIRYPTNAADTDALRIVLVGLLGS